MPLTPTAKPKIKPQSTDGAEAAGAQIKSGTAAKKTAKAKRPATAKAKKTASKS